MTEQRWLPRSPTSWRAVAPPTPWGNGGSTRFDYALNVLAVARRITGKKNFLLGENFSMVARLKSTLSFSLGVRRESDVSSRPIWRIFLVINPRFSFPVPRFSALSSPRFCVFYNCMNTFNTAINWEDICTLHTHVRYILYCAWSFGPVYLLSDNYFRQLIGQTYWTHNFLSAFSRTFVTIDDANLKAAFSTATWLMMLLPSSCSIMSVTTRLITVSAAILLVSLVSGHVANFAAILLIKRTRISYYICG